MRATALDRYAWAVRAPIDDPTVWRTLVVLTDHANDAGLAWPKVDAVSAAIRRSYKTAQNAISTLVDDGYIDRYRLRSGSRLRGYLYRVLTPGVDAVDLDTLPAFATRDGAPDLPASWLQPVPSTGSPLPVATGSPLPVHYRQPVTGQEPPSLGTAQEEPKINTSVVPTDGVEADWPDEVVQVTRTLAGMIRGNGHALPSRGSKAATSWLVEVDRLLRLGPPGDTGDDPPPEVDEVLAVAEWALTVSDFWPANIRSAVKFRQQFTTLRAQMNRPRGNGHGAASLADGYAKAAQALRDRRQR